jgi:hypothetical protein
MTETVSPREALMRSLDAFAAEKSSFYEGALRPMLPDIADRMIQDLKAFGLEIVPMKDDTHSFIENEEKL